MLLDPLRVRYTLVLRCEVDSAEMVSSFYVFLFDIFVPVSLPVHYCLVCGSGCGARASYLVRAGYLVR